MKFQLFLKFIERCLIEAGGGGGLVEKYKFKNRTHSANGINVGSIACVVLRQDTPERPNILYLYPNKITEIIKEFKIIIVI